MSLRVFVGACLVVFGSCLVVNAQGACSGPQIFTAQSCAGDVTSDEEKALFDLVNTYRVASKLPAVRLSTSLSMVANRRMLDLRQNVKKLTHSWSDCRYDLADDKTWHCVIDAPKKLKSGYNGVGYETLYRTARGRVNPPAALAEWKKSQLHNSIILNMGMFQAMPWDEVGIAIDGEYAALWFGYPDKPASPAASAAGGTGGFAAATSGLAGTFTLVKAGGKESAVSADKKVTLLLIGPHNEVSEILLKLEPGAKLHAQTLATASKVLVNLFPEWTDSEGWLTRGATAISENQTATRTKIVRKIGVEMSSGGYDSLRLRIRPQ